MDFQTNQKRARHETAWLILLLTLGSIGTIITIGVLASAWFYIELGTEIGIRVFAAAASLTAIGILLSAVVRNAQVRNGGGLYMAASMGGWPIDFNTRDSAEKQLVNIVEELSIATGIPAPTLFVLRDEPGINALAAGWDIRHAAIGVTQGALRHLTRTEMQAVIAHEFSHIVNGDTQVKTRIVGWVYGIASIAVLGKTLVRNASRSVHGSPQLALISIVAGSVLVVIGSIGAWFARLGQAAITREREHLADASAVEYTRDPDALAGAFLKMGALGEHNRILTPHATEAAHLFLEAPFKNALATHPPLKQRLLAVLPSWDGRWPEFESVKQSVNTKHDISFEGFALPEIPGLSGNLAESAQNIPGISTSPLGPMLTSAVILDAVGSSGSSTLSPTDSGFESPRVGRPTSAHMEQARLILASIPQETKDFLHTREGAVASVIGMLISREPSTRPHELERASAVSGFDAESLDAASQLINSLDRPLQLPCFDIALHSIRETPPDFQAALLQTIRDFSTSSPDIDLFRWMLRRTVIRHLDDDQNNAGSGNLHLEWLAPQAGAVYSVISIFNSAGPDAREQAFMAAHDASGLPQPDEMPAESALRVERLDLALDKLAEMTIESREAFIRGAIAAIDLDDHTSLDEGELIRVIADAVRLPIPPLLPKRTETASGGLAA